MAGTILMIGIAIFGLLIMFGRADVNRFYKLVIFLIAGPILLGIAISHIGWFWAGLPAWGQVAAVFAAPFLFAAVLKALFPGDRMLGRALDILFDSLVYMVTFPMRLIWRSGRHVARRERRPLHLDPRRSVVGGRPPVTSRDSEGRRRN